MGGGGLYSTAADYLAFQRVFLNQGRAVWWAGVAPGDHSADGAETRSAELDVRMLKTAGAGLLERCRVLPGAWSRNGASAFMNLDRGGAGWAQRRQPRVGGPYGQYLFLDRSGEGHRRGRADPAAPFAEPQGAGAARCFRARGLRGFGLSPCAGPLLTD